MYAAITVGGDIQALIRKVLNPNDFVVLKSVEEKSRTRRKKREDVRKDEGRGGWVIH